MGFRSVMGLGKYFTMFGQSYGTSILGFFGSPERPTTLPQALFSPEKDGPWILEALRVQLRCRKHFFPEQ